MEAWLPVIVSGVIALVLCLILAFLIRGITRTYERLAEKGAGTVNNPMENERILAEFLAGAVNEAVKKAEDRNRKRKTAPVKEQLADYSDQELAELLEAATTALEKQPEPEEGGVEE